MSLRAYAAKQHLHCMRRKCLPFSGNFLLKLRGDCFVGKNALLATTSESYKFSSLSVSTMLSLRIIAPETIMVAKTIARMPSTQAAIAHQGRLKAK
jgi:hypothetical protein